MRFGNVVVDMFHHFPLEVDEEWAASCLTPSSWEVLTQFTVPLIGALGSIAVAIVAVVVTVRLANADRRAREREVRGNIADVARSALSGARLRDGDREALVERVRRLSASSGLDDAERLGAWLPGAVAVIKRQFEWAAELYEHTADYPGDEAAESHAQPWLDIHDEQRDEAVQRVQQWARTAKLDDSPLVFRRVGSA